MNNIRQELEKRYVDLFTKYDLERPLNAQNISRIIKSALKDFLKEAKKPALYCNGGHTKMLMADYMYELKKVRYIVDNYAKSDNDKGFILISDEEIDAQGIDAVILSSYKFRKDIKQSMLEKHPDIPVLDIYDEFEKEGIIVQSDYYYSNHPYQHYKRINQLQREIRNNDNEMQLTGQYLKLVTKYLHIKDFRTAMIKLREWEGLENIKQETRNLVEKLTADVEAVYELQKKAAASLPENHVLMLCLDGLRRQDLSEEDMPKLKRLFEETGYQFTNGYSFSTSTFESLIPVYSENGDLRTRYYEKNYINIEDCRFASLAKMQGREIYIYGDVERFIEGDNIHYSEQCLSVTEKLWQFILDACDKDKGLYYLHELFESHFTFSNPYTEGELMAEGTAMLFDFLPAKGGHLRTDYARQHKDAIHYLDDVVEPLLRPMRCRMVVYADHGNLVLGKDTQLSEVGEMEYSCSEGWTRIPLIIRSPEMGTGKENSLFSLMELSNVVVSLLTEEKYVIPEVNHIKLARSELYNPDFDFLYRMIGQERRLLAFECFLFASGRKLMVYADGGTEVYDLEDRMLDDADKQSLIREVREEITVCREELL